MKTGGMILLLLLVVGLVSSVAVSAVGNRALDVWGEQALQPPSATDLIMQSRQTPPASPDSHNRAMLIGAGLLALTMVLIGAAVFTMQGGTELLRQWRLARKRPYRHRQPSPYIPHITNWTETGAPPVRRRLEMDDEQMGDSLD